MRITIFTLFLVGCGSQIQFVPPAADAGPAGDAPVAQPDSAVLSDTWVEAPDAWVTPDVDAGNDAALEVSDAGTDAAVIPTDAYVAPPAHPSPVIEITEFRCFLDDTRHAWCLRGLPATPDQAVYVGLADHLRGECGLDHGVAVCLNTTSMRLESIGVSGAELASYSTLAGGCVLPGDGTASCWSGAHRWVFHQTNRRVIDASIRHAPDEVLMLQQDTLRSGPDSQYFARGDMSGFTSDGSVDLGPPSFWSISGGRFVTVDQVVAGPGTSRCWHSVEDSAVWCGDVTHPDVSTATVGSPRFTGAICSEIAPGSARCCIGSACQGIGATVWSPVLNGACQYGPSTTAITCVTWTSAPGSWRITEQVSW